MTKEQFNSLIDKYYRPIISVIHKMIHCFETAQDLAQDVFIRIWNNHESIKSERSIFNYLYKVSMNIAIDYLRKQKSGRMENDTHLMQISQDDSVKPEISEMINHCIKKLKPKQKSVFLLRDIEGFNFEEIESILEMPIQNIQSNLHLARKNIRNLLEKKYEITEEYFYEM